MSDFRHAAKLMSRPNRAQDLLSTGAGKNEKRRDGVRVRGPPRRPRLRPPPGFKLGRLPPDR
jgi:hypothetical protein